MLADPEQNSASGTVAAAASGVASARPSKPNTAPSTSWLKITTAGGIDTARAWMSGVKR